MGSTDERAVAPVIGVILMVALVVIIGAVIIAGSSGFFVGLAKPGNIIAEATFLELERFGATELIIIQHRGGDILSLNGSGTSGGIPIDIMTAGEAGALVRAIPDTPITWSPGQAIYLYNTLSQGQRITTNRQRAETLGVSFTTDRLELAIIDTEAKVRIYGASFGKTGAGIKPGPGMVNINTASLNHLKLITQINDDRATQIINLRAVQPFSSVDDLVRVSGIGPAIVQQIKAQGIAYVGDTPSSAWVNINKASLDQLKLIIHISDARARQIITLREDMPFGSLDDLARVDGIAAGGSRLNDIKAQGLAVV